VAFGPGTRIGPYEITALLGEGGMGKVWRAHHPGLRRDDALKVLPDVFASDPDRLGRFRREAQVFASLNHPNIAHVYGLEQSDGHQALVMELVEGPTLADRIAQGSMSVEQVLPIATQIADALEAAHQRGIVHRDLKPANVKIRPDGTVKVLDFSLAKFVQSHADTASTITQVPTSTSALVTGAGAIVGTPAYMAPEQAKGHAVDQRSDIWALGCVIYEMVTGKAPFGNDDVVAVLGRVVEQEPNWQELPSSVPPPLREMLRRCLQKDPKSRPQTAGDVRIELQYVRQSPAVRSKVGWRGRALIATAAIMTTSIIAAIVWLSTGTASIPVSRFTIAPLGNEVLSVSNIDRDIVLTPDGRHVVYRANNGNALVARPLDALQGITLATGEIRAPFISPDGRWVGFTDGTSVLRKVALAGGPVATLASTDGGNARGAVWLPDDSIIFATAAVSTGLQRVSARGGGVTVLTRPEQARGEVDHWWPEVLPGDDAILYTIAATTLEASRIAVLDLTDNSSTVVITGGSHATYVPTGHLIYAAGGALMAVPFDVNRRKTTGTPVPVLRRLVTTSYGAANVTVAGSGGTLAYVDAPGAAVGPGVRSIAWVDRQGREESLGAPPRAYTYPRISPDGTRLAVSAADQEQDLWSLDLDRRTLTRLTFDSAFDSFPEWAPDGRRLFFQSRRTGKGNIYVVGSDGSGLERLTHGDFEAPTGFTPDGSHILVTEITESTGWDMSVLALDEPRTLSSLLRTRFNEGMAVVSPEGRWLAYQANDSGTFEIYVRPWRIVDDRKWQVSGGGGSRPMWSHDGRELFYLDGSGAMMRVSVGEGSGWTASAATRLFEGPYGIGGSPARFFDISRDGRRFIIVKEGSDGRTAALPQVVVVRNWFEELKRLVPTN
jgi:serine/threonine protein kinase/Tol biopolymer transport system component